MSGERTSVPQWTGPSSSSDDITSREHTPIIEIPRFSITLDECNILSPSMGAHTWTDVPKQWHNDYYYWFKGVCSWDPTILEASIYCAFLRLAKFQYKDMMYKWKAEWTRNGVTQAAAIGEETWRSLTDKW
ncbi:hypothetical protein ACS0TY_022069 [Phlomoides rotata]